MKPEFHIKDFDKMHTKTQTAMLQMAECLVAQAQKIPDGFLLLPIDEIVQVGDFWLRPTDDVWIETGAAHWATTVQRPWEYCRKP